MRIDGVSATSTPNLSRPAPTGIAQAQPSAPVDSVAVGAAGPARKGGLETSGLFDRKDRQPVDPATISTWSYEAEPRHTLKETFRTPDGRTYVLAESHDTQRDRLREPASYTAAFDAQGQPLWTFRPEGGHLDRFPLKLDNPQVWKIREVLDQGLVVLEGGGRQLCSSPPGTGRPRRPWTGPLANAGLLPRARRFPGGRNGSRSAMSGCPSGARPIETLKP